MRGGTLSVSEACAKLTSLVDEVAEHLSEYTIVKHGRARAVLLSAQEFEALLETLAVLSDSKALGRIRDGLENIALGDTVDSKEVIGEPM
jgi:antitoxin YefM